MHLGKHLILVWWLGWWVVKRPQKVAWMIKHNLFSQVNFRNYTSRYFTEFENLVNFFKDTNDTKTTLCSFEQNGVIVENVFKGNISSKNI